MMNEETTKLELPDGVVVPIGRLAVVNVRPDDVLVFECPIKLHPGITKHVQDQFKEAFGIKGIILDNGMTLAGVVRRERE